jgi:hypothetical protein
MIEISRSNVTGSLGAVHFKKILSRFRVKEISLDFKDLKRVSEGLQIWIKEDYLVS